MAARFLFTGFGCSASGDTAENATPGYALINSPVTPAKVLGTEPVPSDCSRDRAMPGEGKSIARTKVPAHPACTPSAIVERRDSAARTGGTRTRRVHELCQLARQYRTISSADWKAWS